jgi:hypothetical protein
MHDHENGRICQLRLKENTFIMMRREIRVRFGYGRPVDRHGLPALAMTRVVRTRVEIAVCSPCLLFNLHPSLFHSLAIGGSPRQQGARDDKSG